MILFDCGHEIKMTAIESAGLILCAWCDHERHLWRKAIREWRTLPPICIPRSTRARVPELIALNYSEMRRDND